MKKAIASWAAALLAVGAISFTPTSTSAADVAGTWNVSGTIQSPRGLFTFTPVCVFQQAGENLSGTCKGPNSQGPAVGTTVGQTVTWQAKVTAYTAIGYTGVISLRGTVGPDGVIRGVMTAAGWPGTGVFTQQRA